MLNHGYSPKNSVLSLISSYKGNTFGNDLLTFHREGYLTDPAVKQDNISHKPTDSRRNSCHKDRLSQRAALNWVLLTREAVHWIICSQALVFERKKFKV